MHPLEREPVIEGEVELADVETGERRRFWITRKEVQRHVEAYDAFVAELWTEDIEGIFAYWNTGQRGIPPDLDRGLLRMGRCALSRDLDRAEVRTIRLRFRLGVLGRGSAQR